MAYFIFNFTKKGAEKGIPLREQAAELVELGLWGISQTSPNRKELAVGDTAVFYVGAPEKQFIGFAEIASANHAWTSEESLRYPKPEFVSGVSLRVPTIWNPPVSLLSAWPKCPTAAGNPDARFYGGIVRIKEADFAAICASQPSTAAPRAVEQPSPSQPLATRRVADETQAIDDPLFTQAKLLADYLRSSGAKTETLTETATRTNFIDPVIKGLGYDLLADVKYEVHTTGKDSADYVVSINAEPVIVLEAKSLGVELKPGHASQVAKYSTSMSGARWAVVTNGRFWRVYDSHMQGVLPEERLVLDVDLIGFADREDFEVSVRPALQLLSRDQMEAGGTGLKSLAIREAIRETLIDTESSTLAELMAEIKEKRNLHLSADEAATITSELLSS
jgi:hypothetical protein